MLCRAPLISQSTVALDCGVRLSTRSAPRHTLAWDTLIPLTPKALMLMGSTCLAHLRKRVPRADTLFPSMRTDPLMRDRSNCLAAYDALIAVI